MVLCMGLTGFCVSTSPGMGSSAPNDGLGMVPEDGRAVDVDVSNFMGLLPP